MAKADILKPALRFRLHNIAPSRPYFHTMLGLGREAFDRMDHRPYGQVLIARRKEAGPVFVLIGYKVSAVLNVRQGPIQITNDEHYRSLPGIASAA